MGFEAFAIVELMGHQKIAGKVSEQVIAGSALLRVDVPKTSGHDPYTKLYGVGAIYCMTITDEATAQAAAESFDQPPISPWIVRLPTNPALAEKVNVDEDYDPDELDTWGENDDDESDILIDEHDDEIYVRHEDGRLVAHIQKNALFEQKNNDDVGGSS